jgi:hypothetical protein
MPFCCFHTPSRSLKIPSSVFLLLATARPGASDGQMRKLGYNPARVERQPSSHRADVSRSSLCQGKHVGCVDVIQGSVSDGPRGPGAELSIEVGCQEVDEAPLSSPLLFHQLSASGKLGEGTVAYGRIFPPRALQLAE